MSPEKWLRVKDLFHEAAQLAPRSRAAFLRERCGGDDEEVRRELLLLLESHDEAGHFIEQPALAPASEILSTGGNDFWAGRRVGQYRVLGEIGRGGMGVVLRAARADEEFEKQVAIKLLQRGYETQELLRRFRNERQILASLEHPNIARLLDGGVTDDGLPYFVMEYVEGEPLDRHCDGHGLSVGERLGLFRTVCAAVQYAHQHLVVHRDLKPSNILVTADGEIKLLDFGIAKLLDPAAAETHAPTATVARMMTPEYASPEQVRGRPVTTASDIYSLGVILYELLTGRRPYKLKDSSPEEMLRAICDNEPAKPSHSIAGAGAQVADSAGESLEEFNSQSLAPRARALKGLQALRGDLDNIVLMALRKDPERRYKSAEQLSEDIERHLNGLPVRARPATLRYRAAKFIRRHRAGVAAALLISLALVGGAMATLWQARVARREQVKAEEIKNFLGRMLNYSNPILTGKNSREMSVTDVLDEAARRLAAGEFAGQPEVEAELELIIAQSYNGQGRQDSALKHYQESASLMRRLYGERHPKTLVAASSQALLLFNRGELAEAETIYRRILPLMAERQRGGEITAAELAHVLNNFAYLRRTQGDSREAESLFRQALALSEQMSADEWRYVNGTAGSTLASTLADQGRHEEALQAAREAAAELRARGEAGAPNFGFTLTVLGGLLTERSHFAEADANLREAEAIFRKILSPSALWLGDNLRNQSVSLYYQGNYAEALGKASEALNIYRESFGPHYDHYPTALIIRGLSLTRMGHTDEGERAVREAVRMRADSLPAEHYWVALAQGALGECLTAQGRYAEAEPLVVRSYETLKASQGEGSLVTARARQRAAELYDRWKKPDLADKFR